MAGVSEREAVIHVRFGGRSFDVRRRELNATAETSDLQIKGALAQYLDIDVRALADYVIDRHEGGNWTVRPEAVFG